MMIWLYLLGVIEGCIVGLCVSVLWHSKRSDDDARGAGGGYA